MSRVYLDNANTYDDLHLCCSWKLIRLVVWLLGISSHSPLFSQRRMTIQEAVAECISLQEISAMRTLLKTLHDQLIRV